MIFHFFLSDNQGTQEKDQPKKEDQGGSALYSLTLYSFNVFTPFSYRTSLYSDEVHLSAANSPNQVQLPLLLLVVLRHYTLFCVCMCRCSLSFIDFEGRSDGDSIKRILSIVKPRQLVRSLLCKSHYTCTLYICLSIPIPFPSPPPPFQSGSLIDFITYEMRLCNSVS